MAEQIVARECLKGPICLVLCLCHKLFVLTFPPTQLDVAIDGADEVDADLTLIKGGG